MTRRTRERGGATVELVVLTPALIFLLLVVIAGSRLVDTRGDLDSAARDAARAASLTASPSAAEQAASGAAHAALGERPGRCATSRVEVEVARFAPGGTVAVTVSCTIGLADLGLPGLPGQRTVRSRAVAPIDPLAMLR